MIKEVKELRVEIDGLSQLVKSLKPWENDIAFWSTEDGEAIKNNTQQTGWVLVREFSVEPAGRYMGILRSAKGTIYRIASPNPIDEGGLHTMNSLLQSHEIEKCYDSLILAKAWLGKILENLGSETPYKNDGNRKEIKDIEPTSDTNIITIHETLASLNHIEKVDWIRERIKELKFKCDNIAYSNKYNITIGKYFTDVSKYITEARFWLGFELQRIREIGK